MFDEINKKKAIYEKGIILGIFIVIIGVIFFLSGSKSGFTFIGFIFFIIGGVISSYNRKKIKNISNEFKSTHIPKELKKFFPESQYFFNRGFSEKAVVQSKLLKKEDRYFSEDLITGSFDNVSFRCADVKQEDVRRSGKHTHVVTVFQGRFYEFDFFKNFQYNLLLLQPSQYRPFSNLHKIKLESTHFNSEFKVLAKNDHEAFYILTPHFMEKLLVLDQKYRDKISFSFMNNKLYIAIDNRIDSFDIKPFVHVSDKLLKSYIQEFQDIKSFILDLTLNSKLFKTK